MNKIQRTDNSTILEGNTFFPQERHSNALGPSRLTKAESVPLGSGESADHQGEEITSLRLSRRADWLEPAKMEETNSCGLFLISARVRSELVRAE